MRLALVKRIGRHPQTCLRSAVLFQMVASRLFAPSSGSYLRDFQAKQVLIGCRQPICYFADDVKERILTNCLVRFSLRGNSEVSAGRPTRLVRAERFLGLIEGHGVSSELKNDVE
jgi:hypothetical protein